jgi:multidrug efflux pump subunit AcrA (membrane-fusion protein)
MSPIPRSLLFPTTVCALLLLLVAVLSVGAADGAAKQLYTCGMHPQIIREEPGDCPICGMRLQPVRANTAATSPGTAARTAAASGERKINYYKSTMTPGEIRTTPGKDSMGMDMVPVYEGEESSAQNNIQIDATTIQRMNLRTALVERGPVRREFRTVGIVAYNEQGLRDITTKYDGWLEKLDVNATWTAVKAGDPLFEIYSPDLYNAQLNYLVALRSEGAAGGPLTRASLERLKLFDVSADVVTQLAQSGEARRTYLYRAPAAGIVIEKMAVQGQMMKSGERIYRLADLSTVWVNAQIYEKDLPYIHDGQATSVHVTYGQDRTIDGTVQLVLPQVEDLTRTATARIVLPNFDGFLKPGMFVDVRFAAQLADDAVLVPDMAVLRSGEHNTVFVALDGGSFEPRDVKLGARSEGGVYQVLSGLRIGERVVTSGQFMLDSESQLREAIEKMLK